MGLKLNQPENLTISKKTLLMGVLNVTPDSFSDGGLFLGETRAVEWALRMAQDGADIIDVGGESTRPGSAYISIDEELERVIPVIRELSPRLNIPISVDTSKSEVARQAIEAGAGIINNIMGTPLDRNMAAVAAEFDIPLILMHIKGKPNTMQKNPVYADLMGEIISALRDSIAVAEAAGVKAEKIIIDPGLGFGKTVSHNIEILKRLRELKALGKPILVGPSRKAFIGAILGVDNPRERLMGTAAAVAASIANGADIVRVHDVKEMAELCKVADKILKLCNY